MPSKLDVIEAGLIVGEFNLSTREVFANPDLPISFTCKSSVNCCTKLKVPISDKDIKIIEDRGYNLNQIVDIQSPLLQLPQLETSGVEKYYWMKQKAYNKSCRFLQDDKKCEIYEIRPLGCRIFPFSIKHETNDLVQIKIHPTNLCPSVKIKEPGNNKEILNELLEIYLKDLREKQLYFDKYGNKI